MKTVIGLGNPGADYANTRHNAGYMVIDEFQKIKKQQIKTYKSDKFMNESGIFVKRIVDENKLDLSNLYIAHDDLDIKLGEYKIQLGHSPKDHNGIASVDESLGTDSYWHIKVGIDNRPLDNRPMGLEYVLQNFTDTEKETLDKVIKEICKKLAT